MRIYTIGHGNRLASELIALLKENEIQVLVDVRSAPYSRFNPHFNKEILEITLKEAGLRYEFAGKQLGGRPTDPSCYKSGKLPPEGSDYLHEVDYPQVMKQWWFQRGIDFLLELAETATVAILCSEEDPANCHRHHLVARYLLENYPEEVEVYHIRDHQVVFNATQIQKSVDGDQAHQIGLF